MLRNFPGGEELDECGFTTLRRSALATGAICRAAVGALVIGSLANGDLIGVETVLKCVAEGSILAVTATVDARLTRGSVFARGGK